MYVRNHCKCVRNLLACIRNLHIPVDYRHFYGYFSRDCHATFLHSVSTQVLEVVIIILLVIQSCHMMLHCKQVHFSPDLFGGGENDDCLVMEDEDGSMLSLVCCAVRDCHMLFHHTHISTHQFDVYTCIDVVVGTSRLYVV